MGFDTRKKYEFLPDHSELLSERDLICYQEMRQRFFDDSGKSKKGERLDLFITKLDEIRRYIEKGNENDWKRGVVCGIFFLKNSIAINIQSLRTLLGKCKSSINGSLQQLGYVAKPQTTEFQIELNNMIPQTQRHAYELKKWTMRVMEKNKPTEIKQEPFIREIPPPKQKLEVNEIQKNVEMKFPCPIKCRCKYEILFNLLKPPARA